MAGELPNPARIVELSYHEGGRVW